MALKLLANRMISIDRNELQNIILQSGHGKKKIKLNFCGFKFNEIDLTYLDFSKSRFIGCLFTKSFFSKTNFNKCIFEECKFIENEFDAVDFSFCKFNDCEFNDNNFNESWFLGAELKSNDLDFKSLIETDFKDMPDLKKMDGLDIEYTDYENEYVVKYTIGGFLYEEEEEDDDEEDDIVEFDDDIDFDSFEGPR